MKKMGNIKTYDLNESEKDRVKKLRKYYKSGLKELGLNFDMLSTKCTSEILDYFQILSEKTELSQILNSIKKCDEKFIKIMRTFQVAELEEIITDEYIEKREKFIKQFEFYIQFNGFKYLLPNFIETTQEFILELHNFLIKKAE